MIEKRHRGIICPPVRSGGVARQGDIPLRRKTWSWNGVPGHWVHALWHLWVCGRRNFGGSGVEIVILFRHCPRQVWPGNNGLSIPTKPHQQGTRYEGTQASAAFWEIPIIPVVSNGNKKRSILRVHLGGPEVLQGNVRRQIVSKLVSAGILLAPAAPGGKCWCVFATIVATQVLIDVRKCRQVAPGLVAVIVWRQARVEGCIAKVSSVMFRCWTLQQSHAME